MKWYKELSKGDPYYILSTTGDISKMYYAGWVEVTHWDDTKSVKIISKSGVSTWVSDNVFPESRLPEVIETLRDKRSAYLTKSIAGFRDNIERAESELEYISLWNPDIYDTCDQPDFETFGHFDDNRDVYSEINLL